ncbi:unnamed protein product, partial [Ixodes persulcatus]
PDVRLCGSVICNLLRKRISCQLSTGIIGIPALGRRPGNLDDT